MLATVENALGGGVWVKIAMAAAVAVFLFSLVRLLSPATVAAGELMSAAEAHEKASKGEIVLVDVRTPDEWKQTGVPASAHTITMHQKGPDFVRQLDEALGGDRSKPLAIICRTGNRTSQIAAPLEQAGYKTVINVGEGMAGGRFGQGWAKAGLPIRKWAPGQEKPAIVAAQ